MLSYRLLRQYKSKVDNTCLTLTHWLFSTLSNLARCPQFSLSFSKSLSKHETIRWYYSTRKPWVPAWSACRVLRTCHVPQRYSNGNWSLLSPVWSQRRKTNDLTLITVTPTTIAHAQPWSALPCAIISIVLSDHCAAGVSLEHATSPEIRAPASGESYSALFSIRLIGGLEA